MTGEDDIVFRFLHTADWHLGKRFPAFREHDEAKLTRARLDVLSRVFAVAEKRQVHAVLCAGDLFDTPDPGNVWWEPLAKMLQQLEWTGRPVVLLPGNHDPLISGSPWEPSHPFRRHLPSWVHVVDQELLELPLAENAVLYAVPCRSQAGQGDPTLRIPKRVPGDDRIRIGLVHGTTFDVEGHQMNFPISADAAVDRDLDYLAIGDTHGFRLVPPNRPVPPTVYPGAPEPTSFDEKDAGHVAVVQVNRQRIPTIQKERVAHWKWEQVEVNSLADLKQLRGRELKDRVLRLVVKMALPAPELEEAEAILRELEGTPATNPRAGVLDLDRRHLQLDASNIEQLSDELPDVLKAAVVRLKSKLETAEDNGDDHAAEIAARALRYLLREARKES
jgi:DNA repair exonuclease SbcCD nuclease subunit